MFQRNHSFVKFVPGIYLVYLSVPKVASSTISHALLSACPTSPDDIDEHSIEGKCLTHWRPISSPRPALPIFTYVRNPIDKFVSFYKDKFLRVRSAGQMLPHLSSLGFKSEMSIDEVIQRMCKIPVGKMEHHAQPQTRIMAPRGDCVPDFTGRVESIGDTWTHVRKVSLSDFDISVPRNTTGSKIFEGLSEESLDYLSMYYANDFEVLGYEPPVTPGNRVRRLAGFADARGRSEVASIRSAMLASNDSFMALSESLVDEDFRRYYTQRAMSVFNDYLVFSNFRTSRRSMKSLVGL